MGEWGMDGGGSFFSRLSSDLLFIEVSFLRLLASSYMVEYSLERRETFLRSRLVLFGSVALFWSDWESSISDARFVIKMLALGVLEFWLCCVGDVLETTEIVALSCGTVELILNLCLVNSPINLPFPLLLGLISDWDNCACFHRRQLPIFLACRVHVKVAIASKQAKARKFVRLGVHNTQEFLVEAWLKGWRFHFSTSILLQVQVIRTLRYNNFKLVHSTR